MDKSLVASSSSRVHGTRYDVFLSFRGEDTRYTFVGHLYKALQRSGIQTFIDNEELRRGEEIPPSLIKAIRGSKISIIIFSKKYASSSWCLNELVEILECRDSFGQLVWPIFFDVDPSELRKHTGSFGEALAKYEESPDKKAEVPKWKAALTKASKLSGWHLANGDESQLIQEIVEEALTTSNHRHLHVAKYPVGIENLLKDLEPLIGSAYKQDVRFIGVYGMGGIGKTTIAKAIYNKYDRRFEGSSFLANVREASKQQLGFVQLQEMLLVDMLGDRDLKVGNIHRGINIIKERLCNKRVLLILDDVDDLEQLESLAGGHEWFGLGTRIIITSRNRHLLTTHGVDQIYKVRGLGHDKALELLSWNAFKRETPPEDYVTLSNRVVQYANGLPLALEVLGSFLFGRTKEQWESAMHNLEKKPDKKLHQILKISYDALQDDVKALFLDISCFFVGKDKDYVIKIHGSSNSCPVIGIQVLSDMSLINAEFEIITMHQLIEEMGKEIVTQESPEPGKRSRLWSPDDIFQVFSENTVTNSIEGIMLKLAETRTLHLNATSFKKMKRLRILIFDNVILSTAIDYLPNELRLINLPGYQFPTLPFHSGPKQLVILNMPYSHIQKLGKGFKNLEKLKVMNFSHSKFLSQIPNLSTAPNLESLRVDHCTGLSKIHGSVGLLTKLVTLDAQHCSNLSTIPSIVVSKYFQTLNFESCPELRLFPEIAEKLRFMTKLNLSGSKIIELPSSIDNLVSLAELRLSGCKRLVHIPSSIYKLVFLDFLDFNGCTNLSKLPSYVPEIHGNFDLSKLNLRNCKISDEDFLETPFSYPLLEWLDLSGNNFATLPSVCKLSKLSNLNLASCQRLREIPELPNSQINLKASLCKSLVETPWKIISKIISSDEGLLRDSVVQVTLPGSDIPYWFSHKSVSGKVTLDVPPNMSMKIAAVIICAVWRSGWKEEMDMSFQLLDESGSHLGSPITQRILVEPGTILLSFLPASTLLAECLPYSPIEDTKTSILEKIQRVSKINFSFYNRISERFSCACGIHVLWDGDEIMIERKLIKVSDSLSRIVDRTFDDFANIGTQFSWSSRQKRKCA